MNHDHKTIEELARCWRCGETIMSFDGKPVVAAYLDRIEALKNECASLRKRIEELEKLK